MARLEQEDPDAAPWEAEWLAVQDEVAAATAAKYGDQLPPVESEST